MTGTEGRIKLKVGARLKIAGTIRRMLKTSGGMLLRLERMIREVGETLGIREVGVKTLLPDGMETLDSLGENESGATEFAWVSPDSHLSHPRKG